MKVIGITGGVGAGKSAVLSYIEKHYHCRMILSDEVAHRVKEPGEICYDRLVELLSVNILTEDGRIDKKKMAEMIFSSETLLEKVNHIIHPAVKEYIISAIRTEREKGEIDFLLIEAALLIEDGYLEIVDEMWYIYADEEVRRKRLRRFRQYSEQKIDSIMEKQLTDEEFRKHCSVIIDNSKDLAEAYKQIDRKLEDYLCQEQKNIQDN